LSQTGGLYVFGDNKKGQLGIGNLIINTTTPILVNIGNVTEVSLGYEFTIIKSSNNTVYGFGDNQVI
jgi:alpha-tubulin suppressor-like RCC1 family protein